MKKTIMLLLASFGIMTLLQFSAPAVFAQFDAAKDQACEGLAAGDDFINCDDAAQSGGVIKATLETALNILSLVAGVIAVVMVIIGGVKFVTSQGDSGKLAGARSTIIYAIIGLIIVVLAQTIVFFVLKEATPAPVPDPPEGASFIQPSLIR